MSTADTPADEAKGSALASASASGDRLFTAPFVTVLGVQATYGFAMAAFILLPKSLAEGGGTPSQIGRIMAAFGVASVLTIPFLGRMIGRLGRRGMLTVGSIAMAVCCVGFSVIRSSGLAAVLLRGLQGVTWAMMFSAAISLASELAPPARMAQAIGLAGAASLIMNALAPAIGEPLAESFGYGTVYLLAAASAVAAIALALRIRKDDATRPAPTSQPAAPSPSPSLPLPATRATPAPPTAEVGRAAVYLVLGIGALAYTVLFTFLAPFALDRGIHAVRTFFIAYTASALMVRILGGRFFDRIGHRAVGWAALILYGSVVAAAGAVGPSHMVILGFVFGLAHGAVIPSLMALLLQGAPFGHRPQILGIANAAMSIGVTAVFPAGLLAGRLGYPALFVGTGALTVASSYLLRSRRPRRGRPGSPGSVPGPAPNGPRADYAR